MSGGWKWAAAAAVAAGVVGCLGAALWLGGGPGTRAGWEAASWVAGLLAMLGAAVSGAWWVLHRPSPAPLDSGVQGQEAGPGAPVPTASTGSGTSETVTSRIEGGVSGTAVQTGPVHGSVHSPAYAGAHYDYRGGDRAPRPAAAGLGRAGAGRPGGARGAGGA